MPVALGALSRRPKPQYVQKVWAAIILIARDYHCLIVHIVWLIFIKQEPTIDSAMCNQTQL